VASLGPLFDSGGPGRSLFMATISADRNIYFLATAGVASTAVGFNFLVACHVHHQR
jgi:hypothetical protein